MIVCVEVESDMINPELETCSQKTSVLSQPWQQALILESSSPCPQLRLVCQIKGPAFPPPLVYLFTNTPPKSGTSPSELDTPKYDYTKATSSWNKWPFKILLAIWCFAGDFLEIGPLLLLILAMPKILHVLLKMCFPSCCFAIITKFRSKQKWIE